MRGAGEREPTSNPNRLTDPWIIHSLGSGMDETNQKCKLRKRRRETDRSATTRTRVVGALSVSYHSCSGKGPQLSKGPPTARITVANPPFTQWIALILFQSTKWEKADGDSRMGKGGTRHLLNNTKNKAIPGETSDACHECCPRGRVQEGLCRFLSTWCTS